MEYLAQMKGNIQISQIRTNVDKMAQNLNISKEKILFAGDMLVDVNTAKKCWN